MPIFYFHIVSATATLQDTEGCQLASPEEARAEAIMDARALMSTAILAGQDISSRRIDIFEDTTFRMSVLFSDAMERDS